jgi:hypothetical protein
MKTKTKMPAQAGIFYFCYAMKRFIFILLVFIGVKGLAQQTVLVNSGGNIYSVDLINCSSRLICKINVLSFVDIAFTSDGRIWGINSILYLIDTTNSSARPIGSSTGTGGVSLVGLNDSTLLSEYQDTLYGINTKTAQSYKIGYLGYEACGDLTWLDNVLYMTTCNQLIKIVLNDTYTAIVTVTAVNSIGNPIPQCDGLATMSFNGSDSIVGFSGPYLFNQINGTYQLICGSVPSIGADGAASMSFPSSLPVNLLNFTSTLLNKTVQLQWQTTSEINSSYFLIERSSDGVNFSTIGKQAAAGNSNSLKQYSFIDNNPQSINYYRLKEVDFDGKYVYSKILSVKMLQANALNIIGNPVQNNLQLIIDNLQSSTNYLSIFDFSGRRLKTFNAQTGLQNIDVSFLSSGTYVLQMITADGKIYDQLFVKK